MPIQAHKTIKTLIFSGIRGYRMQHNTQKANPAAEKALNGAQPIQRVPFTKAARDELAQDLEARYGGVFAQWIIDRM